MCLAEPRAWRAQPQLEPEILCWRRCAKDWQRVSPPPRHMEFGPEFHCSGSGYGFGKRFDEKRCRAKSLAHPLARFDREVVSRPHTRRRSSAASPRAPRAKLLAAARRFSPSTSIRARAFGASAGGGLPASRTLSCSIRSGPERGCRIGRYWPLVGLSHCTDQEEDVPYTDLKCPKLELQSPR